MLLFHEEKILEARVRLTSYNIFEIANPSRIHNHSREEPAEGKRVLAKFADVVRSMPAFSGLQLGEFDRRRA